MINKKSQIIRKKRNKRGDVPTTVLVLGVFVICTLALISFINSDRSVEKSFSGIELVEKANLEIEKSNMNHYYDEITERRIVPKLRGKWIEERIVFSVEYNPHNP
jgi:hypothetical protein